MITSWIGVDLDGTLAHYDSGSALDHGIGAPVPAMLAAVLAWLEQGQDVRIFTARVAASGLRTASYVDDAENAEGQRKLVQDWCLRHIGRVLPVTATKDIAMLVLFDDRARQVVPNTGMIVYVPEKK